MTDVLVSRKGELQTGSGQAGRVEREDNRPLPELGQWYWVKSTARYDDEETGRKTGETYEWLACVMKLGSNFVELHAPHGRNGYSTIRVHLDEIDDYLRREPEADRVIAERVRHFQATTAGLLGEVRLLAEKLGTPLLQPIADGRPEAAAGTALAVLSGQQDAKAYGQALVKAKTETFPELFKKIEKANEELVRWMKAGTMPMVAATEQMKSGLSAIDDRIFSVELYAGLTETVTRCRDGVPAGIEEKLHIMQRRLYMDEECLLNYSAGGMDFGQIGEFDQWLSQPENFERILPFPRCLVAMRVRRNEKERDSSNPLQGYINFNLSKADELTFLYLRNGGQLWRLSCAMDFGELIFPDQNLYGPGQEMMVKMFAYRVDKMITRAEYEVLVAEYKEVKRKAKAWRKANPDKRWIHNPHQGMGNSLDLPVAKVHSFNPDDWRPFDQTNVYFDEAMAVIEQQVKDYNRLALIIQGLFDRSLVLAPHKPVKSWTAEGFRAAIELVRDGTMTLYAGAAPDFEAYRATCNEKITADSYLTGQEDIWLQREAEKRNNRMRGIDHDIGHMRRWWRPYGDPGPEPVTQMAKWKPKSRIAVFRWLKDNRKEASISIPVAALFNVSAYKPGEYLQFYRDPRTRAEYLKWAPLLLAAEDWHAGKSPNTGRRGR